MDKNKKFEITNTLELDENVSEDAKHRIGRIGFFTRLTKNMPFIFEYLEFEGRGVVSSRVLDIKISDGNKLEVHTRNTIYIFKEIL